MRLLVLGTSDAGALLRAHLNDRSLLAHCDEVAFFAIPGGTGPDVELRGDRLVVREGASDHAAFKWPSRLELTSLREWDVVVISALGLVDTGYAYDFCGTQQGLLFDCRPRATAQLPLVSRACYRSTVHAMLARHAGVRFARDLRAALGGRVLIQPTPLLSSDVPEHEGWPLTRLYEEAGRANRFFTETRLAFLEQFAAGIGAELLPIPDPTWLRDGFTPAALMDPRDGVHGNEHYGRLVLLQIAERTRTRVGTGRSS